MEPTPIQDNHVSERVTKLSKAVDGEVYNAPKNEQALIEEQEVSVAKVVDEVSDQWQIVAETNCKMADKFTMIENEFIDYGPSSDQCRVVDHLLVLRRDGLDELWSLNEGRE
ncbi:hypothetical protein CFP56_002340 [Quercus suber]|uniref:Uncharacterized protein n=1 Tax=Quercus suber TaxID=58331 RepID=A0AAW0IKX5_QUESU